MTIFKTEAELQRACVKYLNGLDNCWFINTVGGSSQAGGAPDLLICYGGKFFGVELKLGGSYDLTGRQKVVLKRIELAGGTSARVTSVEELADILKNPL